MSYASLVICVSEGVREKLKERGAPEHKLQVISIGSEHIAATPSDEPLEHFLFAGRFVEKKGIFVLLDAIAQMRAAGCTVPFVLAGDGPLLNAAMKKARGTTGLDFTGWMSSAELRKAISKAYAVLVPSITGGDGDREGLPSVAVEAMACGVPIIASNEAGLNEVIENNPVGVLARAGDPDDLTKSMLDLLADPIRRRRLAHASHDLARTRFSALSQSRFLEETLLSIL